MTLPQRASAEWGSTTALIVPDWWPRVKPGPRQRPVRRELDGCLDALQDGGHEGRVGEGGRQSRLLRQIWSRIRQAPPEQLEHRVDLVARHGERWHETKRVRSRGIDEKPPIERGASDFRGVVPVQREGHEQPAAADLAMAELRGERAQSLDEIAAARRHRLQEARCPHRVHHRASNGGHEGIPIEGAALVAILEGARALGSDQRGERGATPEALAEGDDVRLDARVLVSEHAPRPPDPRLDLVEDEEDAQISRDLPEVAQPAVGGHEDSGFALDGFQHDGNRLGLHRLPHRVQVAQRHFRETGRLRLEQRIPARLPGGGHGRQGPPVEPVLHGDDLEGAAPMPGAPLPGQLDGALIGLRAAVAQEDLVEPGALGQERGQLRHGLVVVRGAAVDQASGLIVDGVEDDGGGMAEAVHGPALHEIEVLLAVAVPEPRSLALYHDERRASGDLHDLPQVIAHALGPPFPDAAAYGPLWISISRSGWRASLKPYWR